VDAAEAFGRKEAASAISPLADSEQRRMPWDRLKRIRRIYGIAGVLAEPTRHTSLPVGLGLARGDEHAHPPAASPALGAGKALVRREPERAHACKLSRRAVTHDRTPALDVD